MRTLYPSSLHRLHVLLALFVGMVVCGPLTAQTFTGDVTIETQADLDGFAPSPGATYDTVVGNFTIAPTETLADFSNLADLEVITEELRINNYETNQTVGNPLATFSSLDSIGSLRIFDNTTFNSGIMGLSNTTLRIVNGTFEIGNNDALEGAANFPALTTVSSSFIIRNNPNLGAITPPLLTTIGGNFRINDNDALVNLDAFDQVRFFSGGFFIQENSQLANVDGFANVSNIRFDVPALVVVNNPNLGTLGGTPGPNVIKLRVLDSIRITGNTNLTEISTEVQAGASGEDVTLSSVVISNNENLIDLTRIFDRDYLVNIGRFEVVSNNDLNGLGSQNTNITGSINITGNPNITTGGNFISTTSLTGNLTIVDNVKLTTFQKLGGSSLTTNGLRSVGGDILISGLPALINLTGLRRLETGNSLTLNALGSATTSGTLATLDELVRLANLTQFFNITNNPRLSDCCEVACDVVVAGQQVDGTNPAVTISGNTGGCEDKPAFVANCQNEPSAGCLVAAPVEFIAFTGSLGNGYIDLDFSTATESDNDYFQLERSVAGGAFVAIARIEGAGDSQDELSYTYRDFDYSAGVNYYRIRQVDFDGTEAFSDVIAVDAGGSQLALSLFPNPANGADVTLQLGRDWNAEKVTAQVFTAAGQLVAEVRATSGSRLFLPTANLQAGLYAVRVSDGSRTVSQRLTVR